MSSALDTMRASQLQPRWDYLEESVRLEIQQPTSAGRATSATLQENCRKIDTFLAGLDPKDRDAVLAVVHYEIDILLFMFRAYAEMFPFMRKAGMI